MKPDWVAADTAYGSTDNLVRLALKRQILPFIPVFDKGERTDGTFSRSDDNRIQHARLRIGNSVVMLNESSIDCTANTSQMHLFVEDTDAVYERALKAGAGSLMEPND